ncbi:PREDICTED: LOW QUALITY PROTEIN: storkhead-box protein 1-like [Tauraco erythrolophus]|uniref:LOW QUALITY PROTEIN: storkhead-box protein 1-like n=1 Tax=Tauraco erythrolophus TaxID=121530 RepID=UPI0005233353|nr:PREDICTED: LOW QUALITY PROTEIN: storkhead-box protein 1-like [Tauraco erythrolophus]
MNPLLPPRSVPLAEGICRTVSEMNANHVMVTQETLMEQLVKNYPGIAVPSHNILYNILGTLIKERKIYHTGEGYFIVTPNTYFITNGATEDNGRVSSEEDSCCCSSHSITYLVNSERCADLVKENIPTVSHYRSCHCFPNQSTLCEKRHQQLMNHEPNGGGKKGCSELKSSVQTQAISTSAENHSHGTNKSLTSVKEKLKCKRFGLGLFWRSASKKEKHKEYSTFSAQFPPKQWPVRDEDDLDNIPRDIEHEIIKRINPTLTVDNLMKHTILMQTFEEQGKYSSTRISAKVSTVRQHHLSKDCVQKTQSKTAKHISKTKSKKEKQTSRSNGKSQVHELTSQNEKLEENPLLPTRNQQPLDVAVESHVLYKKQINNPFQGLSWRRNFYVKRYKSTINSQLKFRARKQERGLQRPQTLDSSKTFEYEAEEQVTEMQADKAKQKKPLHANRSSLLLEKGSLSENFSYPQGSTLQPDNKCKYIISPETNICEENIYRRRVKKNSGDVKKSPHSYTGHKGVCKEDAKFPLNLKDEYCRCKADTLHELLDETANLFQNVCLSNYTANVSLVKKKGVKYRQNTDKKSELIFKYNCASHSGSMKLESEGFTENCHLLYQKAHNGETCSSFHLGDNFESNELCYLPPGHAFSDTGDWSKAVPKLGTATSLENCKVDTYPAQYNTTVNKRDSGEHGYKGSVIFAELVDGSKEHPETDLTEESCLCSQVFPIGHRKEEESGLAEHAKASAIAGFCHAGEADSDADTLQNFTYEMGEVAACCGLGSQTKETRNPLGKDLVFTNACTVVSGQEHLEGTENHSITGDSGIDSPRWTVKKMKLPAKF